MTQQLDIRPLFANRLLALDRAALPGLAELAALKTGGAGIAELAELRARGEGRDGALPTRRSGAIAIVPLVGVITADPFLAWLLNGTTPEALTRALHDAVNDTQVSHIVLLVDSPGGEVRLIPETAATIRQLRARKPITTMVRTRMASGAYWLGAQASHVVATPSADVGAVGVFQMHTEDSALLEKIGVRITYIASSPTKIEGNPHEPLGSETYDFMMGRVKAVESAFIADLALGRRQTTARVRRDSGDGRVFAADEAKRRGMVDSIATLEELLADLMGGPRRTAAGERAMSDETMILLSMLDDFDDIHPSDR